MRRKSVFLKNCKQPSFLYPVSGIIKSLMSIPESIRWFLGSDGTPPARFPCSG
jgi:hypothetical protein